MFKSSRSNIPPSTCSATQKEEVLPSNVYHNNIQTEESNVRMLITFTKRVQIF